MQENAELERRLNELEAEGGLGTTSIRRGRGRGAYSGGSFDYSAATPIRALAQYKQGTLKALPTDTPALNEDVDVCLFRAHVLHHFGVWSWLLRRAALEQALQTDLQKRSYEGKWQRFVSDHVQGSLEMIQNDMYHILSTYFPPAQSENTKMILDQIDQAANSDTPPVSMKAMMASLRRSLENDREKHIYNAGAYANSLGADEWEPSDDEAGN